MSFINMYVRVHVSPSARTEHITKVSETEFRIAVREPAQRNIANGRVQEILAHEFRIAKSSVRLLTGHRSPHKVYTIEEGEWL